MATIRRRGKRWQAVIRRVDLHDSKTFDRKVDAESWARAKERDADLGHLPDKMSGTLGSLIDRYEQEIWKAKRWGASKAYDLSMLKEDLGARPLETLSQAKILAYIRGWDAEPSTRLTRLSYLREVLRTAKDLWGVRVPLDAVQSAIAAGHRHGLLGKSNTRERRITADELAAIIDHGKERTGTQIDLDAVVRVLSIMPLRLGELCGIGWDDAVPDRRSVILKGRKHPDIKEKEKPQEVPLITFRGVDTYELIFSRPRYMEAPFPYKTNSVSAAFTMACKDLRIEDLHLHDLRAHAISTLLESGMQIPMVALLSGHRNWKVLSRHYARIDPMAVHDALKRLT